MPEKNKAGMRGRFRIVAGIAAGTAIILVFQFYLFPLLEVKYSFLVSYDRYLKDGLGAVVIIILALGILRVVHRTIEVSSQRHEGKNYRGLYTIIRAAVYGIAIAVFLAYAGVSLTGALIGGTVGGLVISFALQNTVSSLLSGLLLATAGVIKPKERISFYSWLFDNPVLGEVVDVKLLTVQVKTIDGTLTELPNTALLNQAQFTNLDAGTRIRVSILVALPVDAQIKGIMEIAGQNMEGRKNEFGIISLESYFFSKAYNSNSIKVIFNFREMLAYNGIVSLINTSFEEAYWEMKNRSPQGNSISMGFPVDVPVKEIKNGGDANLNARKTGSGLLEFRSYFFSKNYMVNTIKVTFKLESGASYDSIADLINTSYEDAYLKLKDEATSPN